MSIFAKVTATPAPRTSDTAKISVFFAGLLVVMAITQLFTFEEFIVYMEQVKSPFGSVPGLVAASLLVAAEVFALPFLLRMRISPAFRFFSMFLGWTVAAAWVYISLWTVTQPLQLQTIGFFGILVTLPPGWWAVFFSFALAVLAAWSSWGLWPGKRR